MRNDQQDAFGHEIQDYFEGESSYEIIERDDGFFSLSPGPELYFLEYEDWPESERRAMKYVRGKVLDVGCGAGRHALYLQEQGTDVLGVDNSPRALEVCKTRGLPSGCSRGCRYSWRRFPVWQPCGSTARCAAPQRGYRCTRSASCWRAPLET